MRNSLEFIWTLGASQRLQALGGTLWPDGAAPSLGADPWGPLSMDLLCGGPQEDGGAAVQGPLGDFYWQVPNVDRPPPRAMTTNNYFH